MKMKFLLACLVTVLFATSADAQGFAHERSTTDFESLLLLEGVGPRTIQSLTLVSEVIYGSPTRFNDPARFSFAHGGKDGHPFPVPLKVYDETISTLKSAVEKSKIGQSDVKFNFGRFY